MICATHYTERNHSCKAKLQAGLKMTSVSFPCYIHVYPNRMNDPKKKNKTEVISCFHGDVG